MKIRSIMPAAGFFAEFSDRVEIDDTLTLVSRVEPLVGWALVDDGGDRHVVGLVAQEPGEGRGPDYVRPVVESAESFVGYCRRDSGRVQITFPVEG